MFFSEQSQHEADASLNSSEMSVNSDILIDRTSVADLECVQLSGRTLTTSALRNLACNAKEIANTEQDKEGIPNMAIYHGSKAVPEYNNPDLIPGMFLMLFPFRIGGFENKQ